MTSLENTNNIASDKAIGSLETPVFLGEDGQEYVGTQVEVVHGQGGADTIVSALNAIEPGSRLFGNAENDYIRSRGVGDRVFGGRGDDTIVNDNGQALIYGDLGSDYLIARESRTTMFGGRSFGESSTEDGRNVLLSLGGKNILQGGGGDDSLVGVDGRDTMASGDGDDSLIGGFKGASFLFGNKGKDLILSRSEDSPDTLFGGKDDDTVRVGSTSTADAPFLFGGVGNDTLMVQNVEVDDAILVADVNPDGSFGGSDAEEGNNYLFVNGGQGHQLFGNGGNDTLEVGINLSGTVSLFAGAGEDYLFGGSGGSYDNLQVFGGRGSDTIIFEGSTSNSVFWGDNDLITSDFGDNVIEVTGDNNTLRGGNENAAGTNAGRNKITAIGAGSNYLWAGSGGDYLNAAQAGLNTTLRGGEGQDTFVFGPEQKIIAEGEEPDVYFGVGADQSTAVTVSARDEIGGEANYMVTGNQSNVHEIIKGGIEFPETDERQIISITEDASGITKTGEGDDLFELANVSGSVSSGGGQDTIEVSGSVSGLIDAGAGDNSIHVKGSDGVLENGQILAGEGDDTMTVDGPVSGKIDGGAGDDTMTVDEPVTGQIDGGEGDDFISVESLLESGVIDSGESNDTITVEDTVQGLINGGAGDDAISVKLVDAPGVINTGEGDNILQIESLVGGQVNGNGLMNIGRAFVGATINGGDGNDGIILKEISVPVGTDADALDADARIVVNGGDGNDVIGFTTEDDGQVFGGSVPVKLELTVTGGNNVIQGGPFSDRITLGGDGSNLVYGGKPNFNGDVYNGFTISGDDTLNLVENFHKVAGGQQIEANAQSVDRFAIRDLSETGLPLQRKFFEAHNDSFFEFGSGADQIDLANLSEGAKSMLIDVSTAKSVEGTTAEKAVLSGAIGVDTVTNFNVNQDQIVLDISAGQAFAGLSANDFEEITLFEGRGGLYGGIAERSRRVFSGFDMFGNPMYNHGQDFETNFTHVLDQQATGWVNVDNTASGEFYQIFVSGETNPVHQQGLFFDVTSGGLYINDGNNSVLNLISVLPEALSDDLAGAGFSGTVENTFVEFEALGVTTPTPPSNISLF